MKRSAVLCALGAVAAVALWWSLTVRVNYGGNWTGLFATGDVLPIPPALAGENLYRFPKTLGYDGQFYHYLAHDPLFRHGYASYIDTPRLRCRRILLPLIAFALSAGQHGLTHAAYFASVLLFIALGVYWLGAYASMHRQSAAWGLAFLATTATVAAIGSMTVDVALAALVTAAVYFHTANRTRALLVVLALAPLARETGILLPAAFLLAALWKREWTRAAWTLATALPFLAWQFFVYQHTAPFPLDTSLVPLAAIWKVARHPIIYTGFPAPIVWTGVVLEYLALAGTLLAVALSLRLFASRRTDGLAIAAVLFGATAIFLQRLDVWTSVYGFGRVFTPLYLLLAMQGLERGRRIYLLPLLLVAPRTLIQLGPQLQGIL